MARLNLSFLGTFQVTLDRQPITRFRSTNNQGLLVYLALNSAKAVSRETLTTLLWPDETEKNARNNLRQAVFQLRRLLDGDSRADPPYLLVTRQTVQFNPVSDFWLDVLAFLNGIDDGALEKGVERYTGELLPGFTCDSRDYEDWLRQQREELHQLALMTMSEVTRQQLGSGQFAKAQWTARQLLTLEPWNEPAHRQLMRAYAVAGERSKAVQQFHTCQSILDEEFGIAPDKLTMKLFEDISEGRIGPLSASESISPPRKVRHNLPAAPTPLIGREIEIAQLRERLIEEGQRLISLIGPGGVGKTRLALTVGAELLDQFQDGIFFVDLASLKQTYEIAQAIALALNYQAPDRDRALFPQLLKVLQHQHLLLIVDNFEHLLDGASFVAEILRQCPDVSLLVTTRQRLNLSSESRYELGGLSIPEGLDLEAAMSFTAIMLFAESGRRSRASFKVTEANLADVIRICEMVQGMPLGLVLAATWLELFTPAEIATEIESSLAFLSADLVDLPPRQRSMHAIFDSSWQMMSAEEQDVLARLSVFRGSFTREAAEQVAGANMRLLLGLLHKSLVQRQPETGRFSLHALLRQFAAQKLRQPEAVATRHAHYFATQVHENGHYVWGMMRIDYRQQFADDFDNLVGAWEHALAHNHAEIIIRLADPITAMIPWRGSQTSTVPLEAIEVLKANGVTEREEVILALQIQALSNRFGVESPEKVRADLHALLPYFADDAFPGTLIRLYNWLTIVDAELQDAAAIKWPDKAITLAKKMRAEDTVKLIECLRLSTRFNLNLHDADIKTRLLDLLGFLRPRFATSYNCFSVLMTLHQICFTEEAYADAMTYAQMCINIAKEWQDLYFISHGLRLVAETELSLGRPERAKANYLEALEWHLALGQEWQTLGFLCGAAAQVPELLGGHQNTVRIFAMISEHPEVVDFHIREMNLVLPRIRDAIGEDATQLAWETGRMMNLADTVALLRTAWTSNP